MNEKTLKQSNITSSFLSCEKDAEKIFRKLFLESGQYSEDLKRLLIINTRDCLDNRTSPIYRQEINKMSLSKMFENKYLTLVPKLFIPEHEEVKSYIVISFDNFVKTKTNPHYRSCTVSFDILCHTDYWDIGDFRLRPLKIAGIIDYILDGAKLSGIGEFQFLGCKRLILDPELSGYTLMFEAVHGNDDRIED